MGQGTEHPGILYFYSESIALTANGCCAFIAALSNFSIILPGTSSIGLLFLIIGGVAQFLCEFQTKNLYIVLEMIFLSDVVSNCVVFMYRCTESISSL